MFQVLYMQADSGAFAHCGFAAMQK